MSGSDLAHRRVSRAAVALVAALLVCSLPVPGGVTAVSRLAAPDAPARTLPVAPEPLTAPATGPAMAPVTALATSPASSRAAEPGDAPPAPDAVPAQQPSTAYLEAMAHEGDRIVFDPGGLVTEGYTPRASDRWPVDGQAPRALPPGRATGRAMAASPNGTSWADVAAPGRRSDPSPSRPGAATVPVAPDLPATSSPVDGPGGNPAVAASAVSWTDASQPAVEPAAAAGLRRQVFGFLPYWQLSGASTRLNDDVLSTIAYFSVGVSANGDLRKRAAGGSTTTGWGGWTSSSMTKVINAAHAHGTRVVLTVSAFAWTSGQATVQKALLGSSTARRNLARQVAAAVRDRGADGVNLDFEPVASGYAGEFVALLRAVRAELERVRRGYQLTYDTTGSIGNYPLEASVAAGAADAIFIMGYDYRTGDSNTAGSIDPLSGPRYDLADTVRAYTARVSPSRVILGLPWYGRAWSTTGSTARSASHSGATYGYSTAVNYENIPALVAQYGRRWDAAEQSPYVVYRRQNCTGTSGCVTSWRQVYYDDEASLKLRLALVNDYGLRGGGAWALGDDGGHAELYRAFAESFLVDKSAPQAGVRMLASVQGDEGFVVGWAARDTSSVVSYDVQVSVNGGGWTTWLSGTKATSGVWLGRDGTGYAFRVRARDSKGNVGSYNVGSRWEVAPALAKGGFGRVLRDGLSYRTGPDSSAARLGTLGAGTIVAVTNGPVIADGRTWYEVTQPVREWNPVTFVERGVWVAARSSGTTYVAPYRAPNSTKVVAGIRGLDFGGPASGLGSAPAALATRTFSPDGNGSRDTLRLRWTNGVALDGLTLRVYRPNGTLAGTAPVRALSAGAHTWDWNGSAGGARVADGRYVLQLVGTAAGRTYTAPSARPVTPAQVAAYAVSVDTVPPAVSASSATTTLVSPNGDGILDSTRLALAARGARRWTIVIEDRAGAVVRAASGTGGTATMAWNGTNDAGARVPDGRYTATLRAWDTAGNAAARSYAITVDTTAPTLRPTATPAIFSPNGDHTADAATLASASSEKASGTARLYHGTTLVRSWTLTGTTTWSVAWNGRNASGAAVPDGAYTFRVRLRDAAGNARQADARVVVDRTAGALSWSGGFFPQDGDALRPTSVLSWRQTRTARTTLRLYDASGTLVRTVWTRKWFGAGSRSWTWNGRLADGSFAKQGRYLARLTVASSLGTQTLEGTVWAAAFAVSPSATAVRAGQALVIRFSTTEPLSTRPTVTFAQPGRTAVKVTATRQADGTYRASFLVGAGAAGAGRVTIRATDSGGHANSMAIAIAVRAR